MHFAQPVTLDALADMVHMSVSSFHRHFKAVTSMTPLQLMIAGGQAAELRLRLPVRLAVAPVDAV